MNQTRGATPSTSDRPPLRESKGREAIRWLERFLIHGEGDKFGEQYRLLPWHREFLWRWYEIDPANTERWFYDEALIGAEAGGVKTELGAATSVLEFAGPSAFRRTTPIVTMAAVSFENAGELFRQAQIMCGGNNDAQVQQAPLCGLFDVQESRIEYKDSRPGRIQRVAARAGTSEGGKETLFYADEVHEWTGDKERVYTVRAKSLTKRLYPGRVLGMSTAAVGRGHIPPDDSDPLLWRLYARGLAERNDPESRFLFDWREAPQDIEGQRDDPDALRAALQTMRAPDQAWSVEVRAREIERRKIPWHEALRYYFNRFIEVGVDSWLLEIPGVWGECSDEEAAPPDDSEVVVGVDMALHHDSVGVVVAGRLADGRVGWWHRAWEPVDGHIDHLEVFSYIAGVIARRWRINSVVYDPRFFELPARQLVEEHGILALEVPQSVERLIPADGLMFELVRDHRLAHLDDPILNAHAGNAAWRETERGRYLSKGKSGGQMDLIRAGAMATWELMAHEDETEPWVWTG